MNSIIRWENIINGFIDVSKRYPIAEQTRPFLLGYAADSTDRVHDLKEDMLKGEYPISNVGKALIPVCREYETWHQDNEAAIKKSGIESVYGIFLKRTRETLSIISAYGSQGEVQGLGNLEQAIILKFKKELFVFDDSSPKNFPKTTVYIQYRDYMNGKIKRNREIKALEAILKEPGAEEVHQLTRARLTKLELTR